MPETSRSTFTVKTVGVGRPDYTPEVATGKPIVGKDQTKWAVLWTPEDVGAGSVVVSNLYTVPTGYVLHLGAAVVTCEASCIQKIRLCHTPGIIGDYRYDMRGQMVFGPDSATECDGGDIVTAYVYNNDEVARDFSVTIQGVLERVS